MSLIRVLCINSSNQVFNRVLSKSVKVIFHPRVVQFSGCDSKGPSKGSGQDDDPLDPCCCEPCSSPPSEPPPGPTFYDTRKFGHNLPTNNVPMFFEPLPHMPTGIFRDVEGEVLGLGAGKNCVYKVPEYFAYHHMTFYDLHLLMRCFRLPCPKTGRKP